MEQKEIKMQRFSLWIYSISLVLIIVSLTFADQIMESQADIPPKDINLYELQNTANSSTTADQARYEELKKEEGQAVASLWRAIEEDVRKANSQKINLVKD